MKSKQLKNKIGKSINKWFPLGHIYTSESDRQNMKKEIYKLIDEFENIKNNIELNK